MKFSIFTKFFKQNLPLIAVVVAGILASRTLLFQSGYFNMHDDLQMMRQLEMEKCFLDGQIPCRWVPDMGYGFGFPLFNFYPPLPYLIGEVFRVLQFSFVDTVKITFALSFIFSGVFMYMLVREVLKNWDEKGASWAGVVAGIYYIWAPYHSVDVYVRGAMNEAWALVFFPLIFYTSYKLIINKSGILPLALSWCGLLLSHNLMVLIFTPLFALWCLLWVISKKEVVKNFLKLAASGLTALGLSAFFTLPAALEQKYVHVDTLIQGYYEFIAHFADINQLLFSRFWGFGPSVWMEGDSMPFPVGHFHWILSLVLAVCFVSYIFKKKDKALKHIAYGFILMFVVGWFAIFMAHSRSTPIWQSFSPLSFVQFPWRFLTIVAFCLSFVAGGVVLFTKNKIILGFLVLGVIVWNWNNFLPQHGRMGPLKDSEKFAGAAWDLQRTAGIFDYLPKSAKENPKEGQIVLAENLAPLGEITKMEQGTDWFRFNVSNFTESGSVRINIFDFPHWEIKVDGQKVNHFVPEAEKWGRIHISLEPKSEDYVVTGELKNTPLRAWSNLISLFAWGGLLVKLRSEKRSKQSE